MDQVSIAHAKEHLDELIERARRGEDVRIADPMGGTIRLQPVAGVAPPKIARVTDALEPFVPLAKPRRLGHLKGKMMVPVRLMEPMSEDELKDWYGDRS